MFMPGTAWRKSEKQCGQHMLDLQAETSVICQDCPVWASSACTWKVKAFHGPGLLLASKPYIVVSQFTLPSGTRLILASADDRDVMSFDSKLWAKETDGCKR